MSSTNPTKNCITLPNGECVSPWKCMHGPPLNVVEFRDLIVTEFQPYHSSKDLLKKFLLASQGKYLLTAIDITAARDLTDDNGI